MMDELKALRRVLDLAQSHMLMLEERELGGSQPVKSSVLKSLEEASDALAAVKDLVQRVSTIKKGEGDATVPAYQALFEAGHYPMIIVTLDDLREAIKETDSAVPDDDVLRGLLWQAVHKWNFDSAVEQVLMSLLEHLVQSKVAV